MKYPASFWGGTVAKAGLTRRPLSTEIDLNRYAKGEAMKHSWQIWTALALTALSFLASIPGVIHPDPMEVQLFDWWGRGSWVLVLNGVASLSLLVAVTAFFMRKPWSLSAVLTGIWLPKVFSAIYMGIALNNLSDFQAMIPKPVSTGGAGIQAHIEQIIVTWGLSGGLAALFAVGTALTALVWWKRAELQGME
jgi:hypothetical protein